MHFHEQLHWPGLFCIGSMTAQMKTPSIPRNMLADCIGVACRMQAVHMVAALASLLCTGRAAAQADAPLIQGESGGWRQGRATFYGGPERFLQNFPDRGPPPEYGFGDALFGSCGYTQQVCWLTAAVVKCNWQVWAPQSSWVRGLPAGYGPKLGLNMWSASCRGYLCLLHVATSSSVSLCQLSCNLH